MTRRRASGPRVRARLTRLARPARGLAGILAFLAIAELLGRTGVISRGVLPLASTVLARAAGGGGNPRFAEDVAATLEAWAVGLAIAVAVAVPCGVVLGSLPGSGRPPWPWWSSSGPSPRWP